MRKVYTCKNCKGETEIYQHEEGTNSPLEACSHCFLTSRTSDPEGWADVKFISFDEDLEKDMKSGDFEKAFKDSVVFEEQMSLRGLRPFKCPKCDCQGSVSKPPHIAGDVHEWSSDRTSYVCDVCNGVKIICG